jgi:hypothetical protein
MGSDSLEKCIEDEFRILFGHNHDSGFSRVLVSFGLCPYGPQRIFLISIISIISEEKAMHCLLVQR